MRLHSDGSVVVSATDLVGFLDCDHLATLELGKVKGIWDKPHHRKDPELELLRERGIEHEQRFLERPRGRADTSTSDPSRPRNVRRPPSRPPRLRPWLRCVAATTASSRPPSSMAAGLATRTSCSGSSGHQPSGRGATRWPTRSSPGPSRAVRCCRSASTPISSTTPGSRPGVVHVVTGDGHATAERLDDYTAYYRSVKARFELEVFGDAATPPGMRRRPRRIPTRSTTAASAPGTRSARTDGARTTISRSWPACRGPPPSA